MLAGMTKRELRETADGLTRILEAVQRGEIDCPPSLATRLDGARVALAALGAPGGKPVDVAAGLLASERPESG